MNRKFPEFTLFEKKKSHFRFVILNIPSLRELSISEDPGQYNVVQQDKKL